MFWNIKKIFLIFYLFSALSLSAQTKLFSVDDLYSMALENSASLSEKVSREKAASFRVMEAKSKSAPVFSFESTLSYIENPDTLTVAAGALGTVPITMPAKDTTFSMAENAYYDFKLLMDQPLFTWGKIYNALQATKEAAAASIINSNKTRDSLKTGILINSASLYHFQEIRKAVAFQKSIAARLENISRDSFENGMILQTDYLDTQAKRKEALLTENIIAVQIKQLMLNLIYLTGRELTEDMIVTEDSPVPHLDSWQELYSLARDNNRDLLILRHGILALEYKNKIQKGNYYFKPDLVFHVELSYSGPSFPVIQEDWLEKNKGNLSVTVGVKSPIADFGAIHAAAKASDKDLKASQAGYEDNLEKMEKYIRQTTYKMELNQMTIKYYKERLKTDLKIMNQKKEEWSSGYGDESDYLLQEIKYYSNTIQLNKEYINLKTDYYTLMNITAAAGE